MKQANILLVICLLLASCKSSPVAIVPCPSTADVLDVLTDGSSDYYIARDGNLYKQTTGGCELYERYFTPNFEADNYTHVGDSVFIKTPDGPFLTKSNFIEPFDRYLSFPDLFLRDIHDTDRVWNSMSLQSPLAKTVAEYNALRTGILNGTESFRDNRIDLAGDPTGGANQVLKFAAVSPTSDMVTSKSSMESGLSYFAEGDDLWYQARYYFTDQYPFSIADFESEWFDGSPGPRIVFSGNALAVENKFGAKLEYRQSSPVSVPKNQWVTVKVHFKFHHTSGLVELWQDGTKILSATGPTLPLSIAIQTRIEVGISSTSVGCVLYVDDVRVSNAAF